MSRPDDLREDIHQARVELAETVDALVAKTEVKRRVGEKAHEVKDQAAQKAHELKEAAVEKAHEVKEAATGKAHAVKLRADARGHGMKQRFEPKLHGLKDLASRSSHGDGPRAGAVRHRADSSSGGALGRVTDLARRKPIQAGAIGLLIGALIALITRREGR